MYTLTKINGYKIAAVALTVALMFVWSSTANAAPQDVQYGSPTSSVGAATGHASSTAAQSATGTAALSAAQSATGTAAQSATGTAAQSATGTAAQSATGTAALSAQSGPTDPAGGITGLLPDTGGSLLFLSALGGLALTGTGGMLLIRSAGRRR